MEIKDAKTAREYVADWTTQWGTSGTRYSDEGNARRFRRAAEDQRAIVGLLGDRDPRATRGHQTAIKVLERAAARLERAGAGR